MEEFRIDMRKPENADPTEGLRCPQLYFKINHTKPFKLAHSPKTGYI